MTAGFVDAPGERIRRSWPAHSPGGPTGRPSSGALILTDRRLVFVAKPGLFGRSREAGPYRSVPLEEIGGASPHRTEMRIGYGGRMVVEGVDVAGMVYELGREVRSDLVLAEIAGARQARRKELGLPDDVAPCSSCGRWVAFGTPRCASCLRTQTPAR